MSSVFCSQNDAPLPDGQLLQLYVTTRHEILLA
jgi:hypothetical protein